MNAITLDQDEQQYLIEQANRTFFKSSFEFLRQHNGHRPGAVHVYLGDSHAGKSTLVRSIVMDAVSNNPEIKIGLWLSEESVLDFSAELYLCRPPRELTDRILAFSELDLEADDPLIYAKTINDLCAKHQFDLFIIDNITTSKLYVDRTPKEQAAMAYGFKKLASKFAFPLILVAHTSTGANQNSKALFVPDDIRGSRTIVNLANFFYIIQNFIIGNQINSTIRVEKHRGQQLLYKMFNLEYKANIRLFLKSNPINFEELKKFFNERNRL